MKKNKVYRQGDVLITECSQIPSDLKRTKSVTLALGEVTGHHHSILDGNAVGYAEQEEALAEFVEVKGKAADLTHQEHATISLPKGTYRISRQVEYTPEALRNVMD